MKSALPGVACKSAFLKSQVSSPYPFEETYAFGIDTSRFQNLAAVTDNTLLFASGNVVRAFQVAQQSVLTIENDACGGVTCLSQSQDERLLAVAYASSDGAYLKLFTILRSDYVGDRSGAISLPDCALQFLLRIDVPQTSYDVSQIATTISAVDFNASGQLVACVTAFPDFGLYVFNSQSGALSLKAKAFTAPVFRLQFNRYTASSLISGGKGHVKFWRMAETFTGSKLKGDLGKFGALSQSDVTGFIELPCGSCITGCGGGELALWESVNVRLVFRRNAQQNCHEGAVTVLQIDASGLWSANNAQLQKRLELAGAPGPNDGWWDAENDDIKQMQNRPLPAVISAGDDGFIRIWSAHQLMQSQYVEADAASLYFDVSPAEEIFLGRNVYIRDIVYSPDRRTAYITDAGNGGIIAFSIAERTARRLAFGHAGPVRSISIANTVTSLQPVNDNSNRSRVRSSFTASVGASGVVFLHDMVAGRIIQIKPSMQTQATKCLFIHENLCLVVGYTDGSVRFYSLLPDETQNDEFCYLIAVYRCFESPVIDIACSCAGVVLVLNSQGKVFLFATSLRLVRKEEKSQSTDVATLQLNQMQQSLVNVVLDTQNFDEESRAAAELARRNARGRLGMCEKDVRPVCQLDCQKLAFGDIQKQLKFPFWLDSQHFAFTVSGDVTEAGRIVIFNAPDVGIVERYRSSHPEQVLQSTLFGEIQHSLVSFDVSELVKPEDIKLVNVHIPPAALPNGCEGTVAKIEQQVMQARVQAMLPSKSALENAMAALHEMGEEEHSESGTTEGEPEDEITALLNRAQGEKPEKEKKDAKRKRKIGAHDPLDEDVKQSIHFDFQQFNITSADGFTTTTASEGVQVQVLLNVAVDHDIRNRADNAMDALRARAEAAQQGISIAQGQDDPATAMAALAVAELRAAYRSSLLYCFSFQSLQQFASSQDRVLTIEPVQVAPVALPTKLISAALLNQEQIDDEQFKVPDARKVDFYIKRPVKSFAFAVKRLDEFCGDVSAKTAVMQFYDQHKQPEGVLCTILDDGDLVLELFESREDFAQLRLPSGGPPLRMVFSLGQLQQPLCQLEIGFCGHLICAGDSLGTLYALQSGVFQRFAQLVQEKGPQFSSARCCFQYQQDKIWSTGNSALQLSRAVEYREEVFALLPRASKVDRNAQNQAVIEIDDCVGTATIEQQRLIALDNADNLRGVQSQAGVQAKIDALKSRYALLMKENENQPMSHRLTAAEIEPDLQPQQAYLEREESRAFELLQNELGVSMNATIERIFAIQNAFPVIQQVLRVYQFSTAATSVSSFKLSALPADFGENLCKALNISDIAQLDQFEQFEQLNEDEDKESTAAEPTDSVAKNSRPAHTAMQVIQESDFSEVAQENQARQRPRTLRPVDKIVRQLLAEKAGEHFDADSGADEFNMRRERIQRRAQAREARRLKFQQLLDSRPNPAGIHPDDQQTLNFARRTFGTFPLKLQDDYISIVQRLSEEQAALRASGAPEAVEVNAGENREGKWREFLLTLKGLQDAKAEFNTRVRVLFAHKRAIVAIAEKLRQQMLRVSAQIRMLAGAQLASELDQVQAEFISPDFVTAFVRLRDEEQEFIVKQRMEELFADFLQTKGITGAQAFDHDFFMQLQVEFAEIFGDSAQFNHLAIAYINQALSEKLISADEATKLRETLDAHALKRCEMVSTTLERVHSSHDAQNEQKARENDGIDTRDDSLPASQHSARQDKTNTGQFCEFKSLSSQILQAALDCDAQNLTVQQLQSFDCGKLVNMCAKSAPSEFQQAQTAQAVRVLLLRRRLLFQRVTALVSAFDDCVLELTQQQLFLQADFCRIRIRLANLFQECEIHHLYVTKDANSLKNLDKCKNDHYTLSLEMEEMQRQIQAKIQQARGVQTQLAALQAQFDELVPRDAVWRSKLLKLYCKRFKLPKIAQQKAADGAAGPSGGLGAEYEDDAQSSSLSDGDSDNGDDEIIDETVPPEGCGAEIFQFVLQLREKKRASDTELSSIQQAADGLRQQHAQLQKREKTILSNIDAANRELTSFRSTKQRELNQVTTAALINISQICSLNENGLQQNFDQALLFDEAQLQRLFARINRRKAELQGLQKIGQQLKQNYAQALAKEREEQAELEILQQKLLSVQQLKFGRAVDIAKLDGIAINEQAAELQKQVDLEEKEHQAELVVHDKQLDRQKDQLKRIQTENTELVQQLIALEQDALKLDRAILQGQKQPPKAWCSDNKQELIRQEYNNLKQAIVDRERELRGLVDEISLLKNHGSQ